LLIYRWKYFTEVWNYIDLLSCILPIIVSIFDILSTLHYIDHNNLIIRILTCIAIIATWLKLLSFARGNENTAFIIRMILNVINEMRWFFFVTFWTMLAFVCAGINF